MSETKEVRVFAPREIVERAHKFAENGLYEKALDLLERNKMVFEIHGTFLQLRTPEALKRSPHLSKQKASGKKTATVATESVNLPTL